MCSFASLEARGRGTSVVVVVVEEEGFWVGGFRFAGFGGGVLV